ncbi:hypothetical protein [Burkholderia gladioli]|uniref:hypothetical protein n=1 Tax=Burkholderia gladioli TaxID=28095 RepID=UPI00164095B1|nr:hypothetical protein [Burkholderia gladioli]
MSFVHADTISGAESMASVSCEWVGSDRSSNNQSQGFGIRSNPYLQTLLPEYEGAVNQYFDAGYFGLCLIRPGGHFLIAAQNKKAIISSEHPLQTGLPLLREVSLKADVGSVQVRKRRAHRSAQSRIPPKHEPRCTRKIMNWRGQAFRTPR